MRGSSSEPRNPGKPVKKIDTGVVDSRPGYPVTRLPGGPGSRATGKPGHRKAVSFNDMTATPLTPARRTYGWRTWQDAARESLIALLIGVLLSFIESREPMVLLRGGLTALLILILARGIETALSWAIEQSRMPTVFRFVLYVLGAVMASFLIAGRKRYDVIDAVIAAALAATTVAFI